MNIFAIPLRESFDENNSWSMRLCGAGGFGGPKAWWAARREDAAAPLAILLLWLGWAAFRWMLDPWYWGLGPQRPNAFLWEMLLPVGLLYAQSLSFGLSLARRLRRDFALAETLLTPFDSWSMAAALQGRALQAAFYASLPHFALIAAAGFAIWRHFPLTPLATTLMAASGGAMWLCAATGRCLRILHIVGVEHHPRDRALAMFSFDAITLAPRVAIAIMAFAVTPEAGFAAIAMTELSFAAIRLLSANGCLLAAAGALRFALRNLLTAR